MKDPGLAAILATEAHIPGKVEEGEKLWLH